MTTQWISIRWPASIIKPSPWASPNLSRQSLLLIVPRRRLHDLWAARCVSRRARRLGRKWKRARESIRLQAASIRLRRPEVGRSGSRTTCSDANRVALLERSSVGPHSACWWPPSRPPPPHPQSLIIIINIHSLRELKLEGRKGAEQLAGGLQIVLWLPAGHFFQVSSGRSAQLSAWRPGRSIKS